MSDNDKIRLAIAFALGYGQIDGAHHKMWVIDQMLRALADDRYDSLVAEEREGSEDGCWDVGIPP